MTTVAAEVNVQTASGLLEQWQGHRRLTRRVIEAFPDDKLFSYAAGGMRPFAEMAWEFIKMAVPVAEGVATGKWKEWMAGEAGKPSTKAEILALWDAQTPALDEAFAAIPPHRFAEVDKAFGQWEMTGLAMIHYAIENEIHHRGQGYVYLRELGIEPPHFWER